jgi:hypothetical protein
MTPVPERCSDVAESAVRERKALTWVDVTLIS